MKLKDLILAVKEKSLTKEQLESYRDEISNLFALMQFELADVKKEKAIFFMDNKFDKTQPIGKEIYNGIGQSSDFIPTGYDKRSDKEVERMWQVTEKGLREIELNHYAKATEEILRSLKSRLYSMYV